jgi:hypothetical protein
MGNLMGNGVFWVVDCNQVQVRWHPDMHGPDGKVDGRGRRGSLADIDFKVTAVTGKIRNLHGDGGIIINFKGSNLYRLLVEEGRRNLGGRAAQLQ